jgi:hypothetical protein
MTEMLWGRRGLLKAVSAGAISGLLTGGARNARAHQVKWSEGTEPPKLEAPPNACDCHHHIYDARYPVDPKAVLRPGDALVEDYRAFQKRILATTRVRSEPIAGERISTMSPGFRKRSGAEVLSGNNSLESAAVLAAVPPLMISPG